MGGSPAENTRNAVRVTRRAGQVQTPSVSPDGSEVVYLPTTEDTATSGSPRPTAPVVARQITFERDPSTTIGSRCGRPWTTALRSS